jgi:hypothetical protein
MAPDSALVGEANARTLRANAAVHQLGPVDLNWLKEKNQPMLDVLGHPEFRQQNYDDLVEGLKSRKINSTQHFALLDGTTEAGRGTYSLYLVPEILTLDQDNPAAKQVIKTLVHYSPNLAEHIPDTKWVVPGDWLVLAWSQVNAAMVRERTVAAGRVVGVLAQRTQLIRRSI